MQFCCFYTYLLVSDFPSRRPSYILPVMLSFTLILVMNLSSNKLWPLGRWTLPSNNYGAACRP